MFAQAARGPILLMTLGALFAFQQSGALPLGRTWPLIIIVIGVMKLLERLLTKPAPLTAGNHPPVSPYPNQSNSAAGPAGNRYPPAGTPPAPGERQ